MPENFGNIIPITELNKWPESIDADNSGNLYFSDSIVGALYLIERIKHVHRPKIKMLINKLKRPTGIYIDKENQHLFLGVKNNQKNIKKGAIIRLPLSLFENVKNKSPINGAVFFDKNYRKENGVLLTLIPKPPNGIVYHKPKNEIFYTWERLGFGSIFRLKGHIGQILYDINNGRFAPYPSFSPNGIVIEQKEKEPALIISATLENNLKIINPPDYDESKATCIDLRQVSNKRYFHFPDGLLRNKNGDLYVAAFASRLILYLKRKGNNYENPVVIAKVPGNPTDLVIAPSLFGNGQSLYVTLTNWRNIFIRSYKKGAVIEIRNLIDRLSFEVNVD